MPEAARRRFHEELEALEFEIQRMGSVARNLFERAVSALVADDRSVCDGIIAGDDEIDDMYLDIERRVLDVLALQTPVASDLRLLTCLLYINMHVERVGDQSVNIAKLTKLASGLPRNPVVVQHLEEMGSIALKMLAAAMDAFARRDLALCRQLPRMDDPLDRLNRGMLTEVLKSADDPRALEWAVRMEIVSRQLERVGDHAVDIGEQVAFLITGEFREFTDASHPEATPADAIEERGTPSP